MAVRKVYTPRLEAAIQKAVLVHRNQVRRTPDEIPYITHLFSVFILLLKYTKDEDTLIAGLLHDAIEDTDYTFAELEKDFGENVCRIVAGVTEQKEFDGKELPWKTRKLSNLENFASGSEESLLICAVDKIYNLDALVSDAEKYGKNVWQFLSPGAEEKLWYHRKTIDILERKIKNRAVLREVKRAYEKAHTVFLDEPCPRKYSSARMTFRDFIKSKQEEDPESFGTPLRSGFLSARIFGYGKRNTN